MSRKLLIWAACLLLLSFGLLIGVIFWPQSKEVPEMPAARPATTPKPVSIPFRHSEPKSTPSKPIGPTSSSIQPLAPWEEKLSNILTAPADTSSTARILLAEIPGLPAEAQEQYIAHALNLCEDSDFSRAEEIYLRNQTPRAVAEAIFNNALNRPDEVKLTLMAKTMTHPNHPMTGEARSILELYLDLKPSALPPGSWDIAVREYLTKQR